MILVNFKTYPSATGKAAVTLAKIHEKVAKKTGADIRVAVQATDLANVAAAVTIPVYAQHIDPVEQGAFTGHIGPEAVKAVCGTGTLLNHSERRLSRDILEKSIAMAKKAGLVVVLCAQDPKEGASFKDLGADFIAVEPPELIGGTISVSTAKPEVIENASKLIGSKKLLVGVGVKTGEDVRMSLKLGARGVLLASGVTKAADPEKVLMELALALK